MYEIRPESIITFIEDASIKLPRFQRKQTWDTKRNFELCISVFKEFPIGVCILNVENDERSKTTKWLLDGRQRRNALLSMWEDPENIYQWGRKWIGFKAGDQPADVDEKFRDKMADYLEDDDEDGESEPQGEEEINKEENLDLDGSEVGDGESITEDLDLSRNGIDFLLQIIRLIHNKTPKYSGFTRPFDFTKEIKTLPYVENKDGKITLSSKKLKSFIHSYRQHCRDEPLDYEKSSSFKDFMSKRFDLSSQLTSSLASRIDENWKSIIERMEILDRIHELLLQSKIGLIELKNIRTTDSQKIFNIINSKGTKLNAVEILSAKPSWNIRIKEPSAAQIEATAVLYQRIDVRNDGVVKWDLPATLLPRMTDAEVFFSFGRENKSGLDKQLTLGFKLLSGIYENGVRKEDVDILSKNLAIDWEADFDTILSELNLFTKMVLTSAYFRFFVSWRTPLMKIMSDAVALNFILVLFKDWKRKGKPTGNDVKAKTFQKNAFILIDQLIFEYVNRQWRGSSDSKIAKNLELLPSLPDLFTPMSKERWLDLLSDIFDANSIDSFKVTQKTMEPILFHFYALKEIYGPSGLDTFEVDHIIPQALFTPSSLPDATNLQNNLFNLALLPKRDNASKSNKRLNEIINDPWLTAQVNRYEFIEKKDFNKYSSLANLTQLKNHRMPIFTNAFGNKRDEILAN